MEKKEETKEDRIARRKKLRDLCRAKRGEKRIMRSSKKQKEAILNKTLKQIGIDKEKFKADLEAVRKQGGLEINMKH
jgi:hypothetical protein